jgi:hypothetical protein
MKLRQYIREMVETELNEMAAIATLEKIKSPEKLEKFKKLYAGNENSLVSKLIDTIEKGSVKVIDAEKAASNPKAQEVIEFIKNFNSKPGFQNHPIPVVVLTKEFGSIDDLINDKILEKVSGATRNGMLVATNKSHTAGISPVLRQLSSAGILSNPKEEGEYIVPKKEKSEPSGVKGRPKSEKALIATELNSKFEADSNYEPTEDELEILGSEFIEKLRMRVMGTLKRGPKNALKNAMKGLEDDGEDLMENENTTNWADFEEWEGACERYFKEYDLFDLKAFENEVYDNGDAQNNLAFEIAKEAGFKGDFDDLINNHKFNVYCNMLAKYFLLLYGAMVYVVEENDPKYKKELDYVTSWLNSHKDDSKSLKENESNENMTLDTNKLKSFISRIKSFGGSKYDKQDFVQIAKLLVGNKLSEAAKMISLLDTSPNEWIFEAMSETYPELWDMLFEDDKSGYIALAKPRTGLSESKKPKMKKLNQVTKKPLNEEFKRMQKLAGLITENENSEIKMDGDFTYLKMSANNLYEYLKNNFPELASLEKCMTLIEFVEENVAQDREDEDEEMELITMSVPEFWDAYDNFYGKF